MNTKHLIAAAAFAVIGNAAFAVEAEQFVVPKGQLTRAEVQADLSQARRAGELAQTNESYAGVKARDLAARAGGAIERTTTRSREEVREEARAAGRNATFNQNYVGG